MHHHLIGSIVSIGAAPFVVFAVTAEYVIFAKRTDTDAQDPTVWKVLIARLLNMVVTAKGTLRAFRQLYSLSMKQLAI